MCVRVLQLKHVSADLPQHKLEAFIQCSHFGLCLLISF